MHIGVFDVLNKVLLQKLSGDVSKKALFFCRFFGFFAFAFKTLIFLCWPFFLLVLNFCVFFLFLLLLFQKSSCYVVVSVFCCIGFPWFFFCGMCCFFLVCVWLLWFFFVGGLKGQSRWPKVPKKHGSVLLVFVVFFVVVAVVVLSLVLFLLVVLVVVVLVVIVVFVVLMFCFCCCCCHSCCCCFGCCSCCCH